MSTNIKGKGFVKAESIFEKEEVILYNGNTSIISKIEIEYLEKEEETYNFEVEDYHTYYVSEYGVLVHNRCVREIKNDESIVKDIEFGGKNGSYEIVYKSNNIYIGKGSQNRMWSSASRYENFYDDIVVSVKWRSSNNTLNAFIQEASWMSNKGWNGKGTIGFYNKIYSPGYKYL